MAEPELGLEIIFYAIVGGFLPALIWLWFWLKEDKKSPEPNKLIIETFVAGGASVIFAFVIQQLIVYYANQVELVNQITLYPEFTLNFFWLSIPIFLVWALIEELVKFVAVTFISLQTRFNDEPIDAMIYMITGALGFVAVENALFIFDAFAGGQGFDFLVTGNLRFLGASLVHVTSSAIIGGSISLAYCYGRRKKITNILIGFILGTLLHALFNFFIIVGDDVGMFKVFFAWWILALILIFFFEKVKRVVCSPTFLDNKNK